MFKQYLVKSTIAVDSSRLEWRICPSKNYTNIGSGNESSPVWRQAIIQPMVVHY